VRSAISSSVRDRASATCLASSAARSIAGVLRGDEPGGPASAATPCATARAVIAISVRVGFCQPELTQHAPSVT